jgi:hypothetical protein
MKKYTFSLRVLVVVALTGILMATLYIFFSSNFQNDQKKAEESTPADARPAITSEATPSSTEPGSADSTPKPALSLSETYKAYLFERTLCKRIANLVGEHEGLQKIIQDSLYNEHGNTFRDLLLDGPLKDKEEILYLKTHREYFDVDIAFHGGPGFVYLAGAVYCVQRDKRMKELETWGPSEMAWTARLDMLNANRDALSMPWNETSYGVPFDILDDMFTTAKKIYVRPEDRPLLIKWLRETEVYLLAKGEKYAADGSAGLTRTQQLEMLREWISRLRKNLQ